MEILTEKEDYVFLCSRIQELERQSEVTPDEIDILRKFYIFRNAVSNEKIRKQVEERSTKILTEDNVITLKVMNEILKENNLGEIKCLFQQTDTEIKLRVKLPSIQGELENIIFTKIYRDSKYSFPELLAQINYEFAFLLNRMKERYSELLQKEDEDEDEVICIHIIF